MAVFSSPTRSSPDTVGLPSWGFDPNRSNVSFCARRMGAIWVKGCFSDVRGTLYWDLDEPLSASCVGEIDVASLHAGEPRLNTELRAADFLDPRHHPTIDFAARVCERTGQSSFRADVVLSLRGTSRHVPMELSYLGRWEAPISAGDDGEGTSTRLGLRADGVIRRQDFEVVEAAAESSNANRVTGSTIEIALDLEAVLDEDLR
ncbi:MAG TPA: YceI family protein [Solirubrobacteraceae bacterium]|jgi:polyisoprenoid-binding protein YceI